MLIFKAGGFTSSSRYILRTLIDATVTQYTLDLVNFILTDRVILIVSEGTKVENRAKPFSEKVKLASE